MTGGRRIKRPSSPPASPALRTPYTLHMDAACESGARYKPHQLQLLFALLRSAVHGARSRGRTSAPPRPCTHTPALGRLFPSRAHLRPGWKLGDGVQALLKRLERAREYRVRARLRLPVLERRRGRRRHGARRCAPANHHPSPAFPVPGDTRGVRHSGCASSGATPLAASASASGLVPTCGPGALASACLRPPLGLRRRSVESPWLHAGACWWPAWPSARGQNSPQRRKAAGASGLRFGRTASRGVTLRAAGGAAAAAVASGAPPGQGRSSQGAGASLGGWGRRDAAVGARRAGRSAREMLLSRESQVRVRGARARRSEGRGGGAGAPRLAFGPLEGAAPPAGVGGEGAERRGKRAAASATGCGLLVTRGASEPGTCLRALTRSGWTTSKLWPVGDAVGRAPRA